MEKITTEQLLNKMKEKTETVDISFLAKVARENNCTISIKWDADGVELWINPND